MMPDGAKDEESKYLHLLRELSARSITSILRTVWPAATDTRSPARPNPLGLHPVTVREIYGVRVKIGPIEAFDGTPVVDIKSASTRADG